MDPHYVTEGELPPIKRNPWADNFFRPLLIVILLLSFNISLVNLVRVVNPAWRGTFLLLGILITTVEAIYSHRVLTHYRSRGISIVRYRAAEWVLLALVLKLLSFSDKPLTYIWANLQATWEDPFHVSNIEFFVMLVLAFFSWLIATDTMADLDKLSDPYTFRSSTIAPLERLTARYFGGGLLLVIVSGLSQITLQLGISSLTNLQRPTIPGIIINVLVYFVLGLILLSQANLARLTTSWRIHKIEVDPDLVKHWARYGLIFLGFVTILVFFLPTRYTMGFLESAGTILDSIIYFLTIMVQFIIALLTLPFVLLLRLLSGGEAAPEEFFTVPQPPLEAAPPVAPIPWLEALRSLIFWLVTLAIMGYLLKMYLIDRPDLLAALSRFRPIGFVVKLWQQIWQTLRGWARVGLEIISEQVRPSWPKSTPAISGRQRGWFGLGRLSARERILYYYLNILKRAEQRRIARKKSETPFEYEPNLEHTVPDVETDVRDVTEVFVRARYSRESFDENDASQVKQQWQRIRKALRRSR